MHPLKMCLTVAVLAPSLAFAAPTEWETVGLRLSAREVVTQEGPRALPYVIAVQERGPAFFAGVEPGDVVSFIRCGNWTWNYIDNLRTGSKFYRTHSSVGSTELPGVTLEAKDRCSSPDLGGLISISRAENEARPSGEFLEFRTATATGGRWLTNKVEVVASVGAARTAQSNVLAQLHASAPTELRKSPCSYDVGNAYDTKSMPPIVQEIIAAARASGTEADVLFWRDAVWAYCSDEKNGSLPSFETAVYLMSTGALKPCSYDPSHDYRGHLDYAKRVRPYSWTEYERMKDLGYMFARLDETQRACFYKAVRRALGKS
jgi:hypothetical protein